MERKAHSQLELFIYKQRQASRVDDKLYLIKSHLECSKKQEENLIYTHVVLFKIRLYSLNDEFCSEYFKSQK